MDLGKLARPGAAQLGDPVQVRRKEKERAAYLRSIQDQFQRTEVVEQTCWKSVSVQA